MPYLGYFRDLQACMAWSTDNSLCHRVEVHVLIQRLDSKEGKLWVIAFDDENRCAKGRCRWFVWEHDYCPGT